MQQGLGAIDERLRRLEFLQECQKQLVKARVVVTLQHAATATELGRYRFLAETIDLEQRDPHPTLWIGGRDAYANASFCGTTTLLAGTRSLAWCHGPDERLQNTTIVGNEMTKQLEGWVDLVRRGPFSTLSIFDRKSVTLWVTRPLLPLVEGIFLIVNDYVIAGGYSEQLRVREVGPPPKWPETLTEEETETPWVTVLQRMHDLRGRPPELDFSPWFLDFSQFTPPKVRHQ